MSVVTLTTDFGLCDGYVGIMKGVILRLCPRVTLVDLTHEISPQNIDEAAFVLYTAYRYFPPDTVHLAVVDPGVGTVRRPLAVATAHGTFVAPDNGVLGYILDAEEGWRAYHLTAPQFWLPAISRTFHGRDIFAPVAAHQAAGVPIRYLGQEVRDSVLRPLPPVQVIGEGQVQAKVLYVDRFGNVVTNLKGDQVLAGDRVADLGPRLYARVAGHIIGGLRLAYAEVEAGEPLLLVGSSGFVELAQREGSAASALDLHIGDTVAFVVREGTG